MAKNEADIALLQQCIKKHNADPFVKRYTPVVRNTIYSMANKRHFKISKEDVEDLSQTAFLEMFKNDWKRLKSYDSTRGMSVTSWVVLLTQHAVWNTFVPPPPPPPPIENQEDDVSSGEDLLITKENAKSAYDSLEDIERIVFKMKELENIPVEDIAHMIHRKPSTVYQILKKAKKKIRIFL